MDYLLMGLLAGCALCGPFWSYDRWVYSKKRVIFGSTPWGIRRLAPFFPALALACAMKLVLFEPFQIPSMSMRPTLSPGSVIVASKWDYNIWLPFSSRPSWRSFEPRRGDVALFVYPVDGKSVFVKRVLGLPGERVEIEPDGSISIGGVAIRRAFTGKCKTSQEPSERAPCHEQWAEFWGDKSWQIWLERAKDGESPPTPSRAEAESAGCSKAKSGKLSCLVPAESYFMMGDNRDDSLDSRYWGAVPREKLLGKALVSFSFSALVNSGFVR